MPAPLVNADLVTDPRRAGARAHFQAMGLDKRDLSKPLIGIATTWTGTMPCNLGQRDLAQHVAAGVRAAGGTPMEFNTIAVSDNQTQGMPTMRTSLVSREVIADSIELVATSQPFDGLVCLVGCDKTVPGAVMALLRLDVPGLVLYSGAMAVGSHRGKPVTIQNVWEAVGAHEAGQLTDEELAELERDACPGIGSCTGHFTANTMAVAVDFLGLGPIGLGWDHGRRSGEAGRGRAGGAPGARRGRAWCAALLVRHRRGATQRDRRRLRHRRLDELGAASARDRRRGGNPARARGLRPGLGGHAGRHESHPGRPLRRRRPPAGRRHRRRDEAAPGAAGHRRADGRRSNDRRARRLGRGARRRGDRA